MTRSRAREGPPADAAVDDPIVPIFREHTQLQVLAARLIEIAGQLSSDEVGRDGAVEALDVHRRFVVQVHLAREAAFRSIVGPTAPGDVRRALEKCAVEHPRSERWEAEVLRSLGKGPLSPDARRELARLFRREADQIVEHHREEDETIYRRVHFELSEDVRQALVSDARARSGEAAAAQERVTAWGAHGHAGSD